jgi:hypothetical protein
MEYLKMLDSGSREEIYKKMIENSINNIEKLGEIYKFDIEGALKIVNLERCNDKCSEKCRKVSIIMPFCGEIKEEWCKGVRLNYGLYSQCQNKMEKNNKYCKTCNTQCSKSGTGKPTYGNIEDRVKAGENYVDPKGKSPVRYANIMEKLNITRKDAEREAERLGLKIPEEEFVLKVAKRGRPKKSVEVSDTDSEKSEPIKKKRGRPRKEKAVVSELATGDDLIAGLLKKAEIEKTEKKELPLNSEKIEELEEEEEEVEVEVERFTDPNTSIEYYKTEDNVLYSMDQEPVGKWDPKTNTIIPVIDSLED